MLYISENRSLGVILLIPKKKKTNKKKPLTFFHRVAMNVQVVNIDLIVHFRVLVLS